MSDTKLATEESPALPTLHIGAPTEAKRDAKGRLAAAVRALPLTSRSFGPPRRIASWSDYPKLTGAIWKEVVPSAPVARPKPAFIDFDLDYYLSTLDSRFSALPAAGVIELRQARLVSDMGWIVSADDAFLANHSWYGGKPELCPLMRRLNLQPQAYWEGTTLSLASDWAAVNYAHMLHDGVARLHLFEASGGRWEDIDRVVLPDLDSPGRQALAELAGVPMAKVTPLSKVTNVVCERLIAPSFPGQRRDVAPWAADYWRGRKGASNTRPTRRLYATRRGWSRKVTNDEEVSALLASYGFEVLEPSAEDKSDVFRDAEFVVGPHGAALSNSLFMSPGNRLIEFTPTRFPYPYFYTIAAGAGLAYGAVASPSDPTGPANHADITVPIDALKAALRALGA